MWPIHDPFEEYEENHVQEDAGQEQQVGDELAYYAFRLLEIAAERENCVGIIKLYSHINKRIRKDESYL